MTTEKLSTNSHENRTGFFVSFGLVDRLTCLQSARFDNPGD
jgi:hypothetical protein